MHLIKKLLLTSVIILIFLSLTEKTIAGDLKDWGEVNPEFLEMKVYPDDTSAEAFKIYDQCVIDLRRSMNGVEMILQRHFQIKILKEKGIDLGDMSISYWHKDKISDIEAQIILPNGETVELNSDNIFDEEAKNQYKVKNLAFPNVQIGSILEVMYEQTSTSIYELEPWYFHQPVPVVESELIIRLDPLFSFFVKKGNDPDQIIKESTEQYYSSFRKIFEDQHVYKAVNLPAIKTEPYISTLNNYRAHINFQIESVNFPGYYQSFIQDIKTLSNTLLEKEYNDFEEPESDVKELVKELLPDQTNNNDKICVLFEYVRDNFGRDENTGIYTGKDQSEILEKKKGSETEKNLLLKVMLQAAGFEVIPVLISTKDHGLASPEIPFLSQFNRTILLVSVDNNYYLFDARDPWITYGQLPPNSLVKNALLLQKDNPVFIEIPGDGLRSLQLIESHMQITEEGSTSGTSEILAVGYGSSSYNRSLYDTKKIPEFLEKKIAKNVERFSVTKFDSALTAAPTDTFKTKYDFSIENLAEVIEGEIYLNPGFYLSENSNPFVSEKRVFPVEFGYCWKTIETNYFTLPDKFSISELPKDVVVDNNYFRYQRTILVVQVEPLILGFSRQFEIKSLTVPTGEYTLLRSEYSKIIDADQEIVILKKVN